MLRSNDEANASSAMTPVYETPTMLATGCRDCDVPGYLIVSPKRPVARLYELPSDLLSELMPTLAKLEAAIVEATGAERVYLLRFSEGHAPVHFHLFPRTPALAREWRSSNSLAEGADLIGEELFGWARLHKRVSSETLLSQVVMFTLQRIREIVR